MSIDYNIRYPTQTQDGGLNYPYRMAQEITLSGDNTGTPWDENVINDQFAKDQSYFLAAGTTPNNTIDTVLASQHFNNRVAVHGQKIADKATAKLLDPIEGKVIFITSYSGQREFTCVHGLVGQSDDGATATACATQFIPDGGDGTIVWRDLTGYGNTHHLKWHDVIFNTGAGAVDSTTEFQNAIAASNYLAGGVGTILISGRLEQGWDSMWWFEGTCIKADTGTIVMVARGVRSHIFGSLKLDGNSVSNVVLMQMGIESGGVIGPSQYCHTEHVYAVNGTTPLLMRSDGNSGIYYNHFVNFYADSCTGPIIMETTTGIFKVNSNYFGTLNYQSGADGLVIDGANDNCIANFQCEANSGRGLDIIRGDGNKILSGRFEDNGGGNPTPAGQNIRIANNPEGRGTIIHASVDNNPTSVDITPSTSRSITLSDGRFTYNLGESFFHSAHVCDGGVAAADDIGGLSSLRLSGGTWYYRLSPGSPYYYHTAPTDGVGHIWRDNAGARELLQIDGGDPSVGETGMMLIMHNALGTVVSKRRVIVGPAGSGSTAGRSVLEVVNF